MIEDNVELFEEASLRCLNEPKSREARKIDSLFNDQFIVRLEYLYCEKKSTTFDMLKYLPVNVRPNKRKCYLKDYMNGLNSCTTSEYSKDRSCSKIERINQVILLSISP